MSLTLDMYQARDAAVAGVERALIATILAHPDQIQHAELLLPQDFASSSHQTFWSEIISFYRENQLSLQAVFQSLQSKGLLDTLGSEFGSKTGVGYLNEMMSYAAPQSTDFFAKSVLDNATKRAVRRSAALLAADCDDPNMPADELLDKAESAILEMRRTKGATGQSIGSILGLFETVVEKRRSNTFVPALAPHIIPIKTILKFFEEQDYPIIAARPGEGKCLGRGTKVVMFDGSLRNVEDIQIGDLLMGVNSEPRKVLSTTTGTAMMYWVRQNRGIDYRVNEHHILSLKRSKNEYNQAHGETRNISVAEWRQGSPSWHTRWKGYKVAVEFPVTETPLEPYFLGLWLGDGTSSGSTVPNVDPEVISYLEGYASRRSEKLHSHKFGHSITRERLGHWVRDGKSVRAILRTIGVLNDKHIPVLYLRNSCAVRWQVLAGLIDTDGHMIHNGIEFTQKSLRLTQDIVFLANSLGLRASPIYPHHTRCQTGAEGTAYRITIHGDFSECPIRIAYKRPSNETKRVDWTMTGIRIEPDKVDDYFGFMLDGDGLFLLEDMTVTHNSSIIRYEAFHEAMEGRATTIINLENGELEYARHLVAMQTGLDNELLRNPSALRDHQMQDVKDAIRRLKSIPLTIVTLGAPPVEQVEREYLAAVRNGAKSVWVDYIQLVNNKVDSPNVNLTITSTRLRGLPMRHHVPLVAASQMSRNIVNRGVDAEPQLSDLRDSGSLEQDATQVIFPRLACGPNPTAQQLAEFVENRNADGRVIVVPLKVYVRKNRNGSVGVTNPFKWNMSTNSFEALTDEPARVPRPPRARQPVQEVLEAI